MSISDKNCYILGISSYTNDSAAVILCNGVIVAAAQEERFTRKKHDPSFPERSVEYCLDEAGIKISDISLIAVYEKPLSKIKRYLDIFSRCAPAGAGLFLSASPRLSKRAFVKRHLRKKFGYTGNIISIAHQFSQAAGAFFPSPFEDAAIAVLDGAGENSSITLAKGSSRRITPLKELYFPDSLWSLYSAFTSYCGFKVQSGEYKLMGLAPYGEPKYAELILTHLIDLKDDGSFRINTEYFDHASGGNKPGDKFMKLFGSPPRKPGSEITRFHMDIARSIQAVTEKVILRIMTHAREITGCSSLCLSGDLALNCVSNGKVMKEGPFKNIWVQPASSDAGGALGAALAAWHGSLGKTRHVSEEKDSQKGSLLGPSFSDNEISTYLSGNNIPFKKIAYEDIAGVTSGIIASGKVVGWFQGRMEFGPRALGSRSILADPRAENMRDILNLKVKFREPFRPFALSVLADKAKDFFYLEKESPYMLFTAQVRTKNHSGQNALKGLEKLSDIPAVTHVDLSARIQTVKPGSNALFYDLISDFGKKTGYPILLNTSFNVRGEPIVCSPDDAYRCFLRTNIDYLVMGQYLVDKKDIPGQALTAGAKNNITARIKIREILVKAGLFLFYAAIFAPAMMISRLFTRQDTSIPENVSGTYWTLLPWQAKVSE